MNEVDPWEIIEKLRLQHKEEIHEQWMPLVAEYREQVDTLQSRLEELNQKVVALQQENASLKEDAGRFRKLAYLMRFDKDGEYVTMDLVCPVDATSTHDLSSDWMEPAFTESVRRTVDASM